MVSAHRYGDHEGPVNLRDAMTIAAKYAGDGQFAAVVLRDGVVRVQSPHGGIEVICPDAKLGCAVEAQTFLKMLRAAKDPKVAMKGRKLTITWGGSSYTLQAVHEADEVPWPEIPPATGWVNWEDHDVAALSALCDHGGDRWKLRLHPHWCAATDGQMCAIAWVVNKAPIPAVIAPDLFKDLPAQSAQVFIDDRRVWLKTSDQIRWVPCFSEGFPDDVIAAQVSAVRSEHSARAVVRFPVGALEDLAKQAIIAAPDKARGFALMLEASALLYSSSVHSSAAGAKEFQGTVEVEPQGAIVPHHKVGIEPAKLALIAKIFGRYERALMSLGANTSPIVVWSGDKIITEVLVVPYTE